MEIRDRIVELRRVKAGELVPSPRNWRRHPAQQVSALKAVLERVGYAGALIARDTPDGLTLIDGHARAALDADQIVPVLILDVDEQEADILLASMDPLAAMAETDREALQALLADIPIIDQGLTEYLEHEARMMRQIEEDEVPEPPSDPVTKPGDLWLLGRHRVLCADATKRESYQRLLGNERAELLLTDPPYGVSHGSGITEAKAIRGDIGQAVIPLFFACAIEHLDDDARLYVFGGGGQVPMYMGLWDHHLHQQPRLIVWVKESFVLRQIGYHSRFELIYWGWKGKGGGPDFWYGDRKQQDVWEFARPLSNERTHPTQKPVELLGVAISNSCAPGGSVLEPFAGSGSTLIACEQLDRTCYAMEIDPGYCDVIVQRFEQFTGEKAKRA